MRPVRFILCVIATMCCMTGLGQAAQVTFEGAFSITSVSGPNSAGLATGDEIVFTILVDNGGGIASNSWSATDVISATAGATGYTATFNAPFLPSDPIFSTDGSGTVSLASWFDNDDNNTDTSGPGSPKTLGAGLLTGDGTTYGLPPRGFDDPANWTATLVAQVPLPAGGLLLFGGLAGLLLLRRRAA